MYQEPKVAKEDKIAEAIKRMEMIALSEDAKKHFQEGNIVPFCINGVNEVYGLNKDSVSRITDFEREHHALVYAVIFVATNIGNMESYLYVSDWEEEWESDRFDITEGYAMSWTENLTYPQYSEFGSIGFKQTTAHGIKRTN